MHLEFPHGQVLRLMIGDITAVPVDAIVNAANSQLQGGGGVDGAIHRAAGPSFLRELAEIRRNSGPCPTGSAVVTGAGALPARFVFHAVGPIYTDGAQGEPQLLASCYRKCLEFAEERDLRRISFPAISTGVYGYPTAAAAQIAVDTVAAHLRRSNTKLQEVLLVLWGQSSYDIHSRVLSALPPSR